MAPELDQAAQLHRPQLYPGDLSALHFQVDTLNIQIRGDLEIEAGHSDAMHENVNGRLNEFQLFSEQTISDLENADITAIITNMNSDQIAVEASFAVISRLAGLNLSRFLR